ncbi:MAG TPA: response regulator [Syntrophales bacterium]|nr:response regulator [Syntrophales bacterium]
MSFNVLIVDDSAAMRSVIKKIVALSGFKMDRCLEAGNGKEALEILSHTWVDVILSDLNMPEMGGMEMLAELKRDKMLKEIPVIIVTTEGSEDRKHMVCTMGASGFIRKPFLPEEVRKILCQVLGVNDEGSYGEEQSDNAGSDF